MCDARHSRRQLAHSLVSLALSSSRGGFAGQLHAPECVHSDVVVLRQFIGLNITSFKQFARHLQYL
jgi:hypothetical protein